ncbi:MAG: DUF3179 domain-containing (seleno)protein [Terriglobia bacterium]
MHEPQFIPASQAIFLSPDDLLIGVTEGKTAMAYPAAILAQHGVVQDQTARVPIAVTWCSYCNTALVFRTTVRGKALVFDTGGVIGGNEVFRDRQTGSRWQQSTFEAVSGSLKGTHLTLYPFLLTTWSEWRRLHPETLVLKPLPGYADRLAAENEIVRQAEIGMPGPAHQGAFGHDTRLRPKDTVVGLEAGGDVKAYSMSALERVHVVNDSVGGTPILIVHQPASDTTTAFVAQADGKTLKFRAADANANRLTDLESHSTWDAYGVCTAGRLKGTRLKSLILEPEFWFAWSEFHPNAPLYGSSPAR